MAWRGTPGQIEGHHHTTARTKVLERAGPHVRRGGNRPCRSSQPVPAIRDSLIGSQTGGKAVGRPGGVPGGTAMHGRYLTPLPSLWRTEGWMEDGLGLQSMRMWRPRHAELAHACGTRGGEG